jgi:hypothetical protein
MKCERAVELLTRSVEEGAAEERRLAADHVANCGDCRDAATAVHALRIASLAPVPDPRPGAFERVIAAATSRPDAGRRSSPTFWSGMGLGAALAAGVVIAILALAPATGPETVVTPRLSMALNESRDVSISLTAPEALADAEIHVVLSGAVGLDGYEGQRELRWRTNLDPGVNQLTLPVIATGAGGGQVLVEVLHEGKRRTFLVDVSARG